MIVREEGGVDALVEHKSEAAFRCEEAKFLIAAALRQLLTDLGGSDCGVPAFPGRKELKLRPPMLDLRYRMLCLDFPEKVCSLRICLEFRSECRTDFFRNVEFG